MTNKMTLQKLIDFIDCEFSLALQLVNNPQGVEDLLNLIEEIKKARAADMINGTMGQTLQSLYEQFMIEGTEYAIKELEKMGLYDNEDIYEIYISKFDA